MRLFHDDGGFSTLGMVIALLLTLSLVFTTAQVYRVHTEAAAVQDVADAAALAAQGDVAEFMIVARTCDAIILSLTLTSFVATGLGVAALCTPVTAEFSVKLLDAGKRVLAARDSFSEKAASGLDTLQCLLPFASAVSALRVTEANNGETGRHSYAALAVVVPQEGAPIAAPSSEEAKNVQDKVDSEADRVREEARKAEEAAKQADEAKQIAFDHDCGLNPNYCMYERAASLAYLSGADNPLFESVDSWSFSVALERARKYYDARLSQEGPDSDSVEDRVRSLMRARFYEYAIQELGNSFVHETADSFDSSFALLPHNTDEMRQTSLFYEDAYPITNDGALVMHAWAGCPSANGIVAWGSISQMEAGGFQTCGTCGFTPGSLGNVASASTNIDNGFEHHYRIVAQQAEAYRLAREGGKAPTEEVKRKAGGLIDELVEAFVKVANKRLEVSPPGSKGVITLAVDSAWSPSDAGFETSFVRSETGLGTRAAVSGATMLADPSGEGKSILTSILDNVRQKGGLVTGGFDLVLECWAKMLGVYTSGQEALSEIVESIVCLIPFASHSKLGTWASEKFVGLVKRVGLQPANLDALRPVLVNTSHVANSNDDAFCVGFQSVKSTAIEIGLSGGIFDYVVARVKEWVVSRIPDTVQIAVIEPLGSGGPSIPLVIKLPEGVRGATEGLIERALGPIRGLVPWRKEMSVWQ